MAEKAKKQLHVRDFENMEDEAILTQVLEDMRASETFQSPYFDKFRRFYKLYRSFIDAKDKKKDRSNLFIPYTFNVIETVTPKLVLSIFKSRPYVQTMPLGLPNPIRELRAKKMNKLLDFQLQQKIKIVPVCSDVIKTAAIYGTAITKQGWEFKTQKLVRRKPETILGMPIPGAYKNVLVEAVVKDDPKVTLVPLLDFFFDPAGTEIEEQRYNIHRYWEDLHEIEAKAARAPKMYRNLDKLREEIQKSGDETGNKQTMLSEIGISAGKNGAKGVEIWEYHTGEWVVKVANQRFVIYSNMNPYHHMKKPFAKWVNTPVPNEFYGMGEVEAIEQLQYELNTTRNQRIDNVSFVLNKMWKIKRSAQIDTTQLISRPAGFIEVDEMEDVEEIKFSDVTASAYQEEANIKDDIDVTSGVHDTERGSTPQRRETATTMNILATAGSQRFELKTIITEYGGFHDMINQIIQLNQQYIDRPKEIMILGDNGVLDNDTVTPEEIMGEWTLVAVGSAMEAAINKEMRQSNIIQMYNMLAQRPELNHTEFIKQMLEEFDFKNVDRFIIQQQPMIDPVTGQPMMPQAMPMPMTPPVGGNPNG